MACGMLTRVILMNLHRGRAGLAQAVERCAAAQLGVAGLIPGPQPFAMQTVRSSRNLDDQVELVAFTLRRRNSKLKNYRSP